MSREGRKYFCAVCGRVSDRGFIQLCRACSKGKGDG